MRFKKIKVTTNGKLNFIYEINNNESWDEISYTSSTKAQDSFHTALQALANDVIDMCELPDEYREKIQVSGVSFSYGGEKEIMGATIIASMFLQRSNVNLNLNTPHKIREPYSGDVGGRDERGKQLLSTECVYHLDALITEAKEFIRTVKKKLPLFQKEEKVAA